MSATRDQEVLEDLSDEAIIEQVVGRLSVTHRSADPQDLEARVKAAPVPFAGAPIRHFLPVLLERRVAAQLS